MVVYISLITEGLPIGNELANIFLNRVKSIMIMILHSTEGLTGSQLSYKLANREDQIYKKGRKIMVAYRLWKSGKALFNIQAKILSKRKKIKTY